MLGLGVIAHLKRAAASGGANRFPAPRSRVLIARRKTRDRTLVKKDERHLKLRIYAQCGR
jgi:hypothetical protein